MEHNKDWIYRLGPVFCIRDQIVGGRISKEGPSSIQSPDLAEKQSFIQQVSAHAWTLNECVVYWSELRVSPNSSSHLGNHPRNLPHVLLHHDKPSCSPLETWAPRQRARLRLCLEMLTNQIELKSVKIRRTNLKYFVPTDHSNGRCPPTS